MQGGFQDLIEALERVERRSAEASASVKSARQDPSAEKVGAMIDELHALQKDLKYVERRLAEGSHTEILEVLRAMNHIVQLPDEE